MEIKRPLLSICIPTYNRAKHLQVTLQSIVSQKEFIETSKIEIVISDNCSEDNTMDIVKHYLSLFPDKIVYNRNDINIKDGNFEKVLSLGRGTFLKLNNDTLVHKDNSLKNLIQIIQSHINKKDLLFFSNGNLKYKHPVICNNADEFLQKASFFITWIGAFGIWKSDFKDIRDFNKFVKLQLAQVDVTFRVINKAQKDIYIYNDSFFNTIELSRKGGYDIISVFIDNYSTILLEQVTNKILTFHSYQQEMKNVLLKFICPWLVTLKVESETFTFDSDNAHARISKFYNNNFTLLSRFYFRYVILYLHKKSRILIKRAK